MALDLHLEVPGRAPNRLFAIDHSTHGALYDRLPPGFPLLRRFADYSGDGAVTGRELDALGVELSRARNLFGQDDEALALIAQIETVLERAKNARANIVALAD